MTVWIEQNNYRFSEMIALWKAEDIFYKPFHLSAEATANIFKAPSDCMSTRWQSSECPANP